MKRTFFFVMVLVFASTSNFYARTPYGCKIRTIPGVIEAEDFDIGGEGVGYHDRQTKNPGGFFPGEQPLRRMWPWAPVK